jgi:N-hydroxyarylamine O-acetyltransferase
VPNTTPELPTGLVERTLEKLGLSALPSLDLKGLSALYGAWCRRVPFDNVRKLIHLNRKEAGPLPGDSAVDFLTAWLRYGTGGTCWSGNGALFSLLESLGFDVKRGLGTMLAAPNLPPNHGTVVVDFGRDRYIVDASILHGTPLQVADQQPAEPHLPWSVQLSRRQDHWIIHWRPLHKPDGFDCRIEEFNVPSAIFADLHEKSRPWSPFNYQLYARINRINAVVGTAFGQRGELVTNGGARQCPLEASARVRFLVEELAISEELAAQLPPDRPTPPPPR